MRTILASALLVAAAAAPAAADNLIDSLRAGKTPVYFTRGDDGLHARGADGKLDVVLAPGAIDHAYLDQAHDLVWFTEKGTLSVIDLRAPAGPPVPIATKLPDGIDVRVVWGKDDSVEPVISSHAEIAVWIAAKPKLKAAVAKGADWDWWYKGGDGAKRLSKIAKAAKKAKLVGGKWLKAQVGRSERDGAPVMAAFSSTVKLPDAYVQAHCEDATECGSAADFGGRFQLVAAAQSCGDFCYQSCLLYDPKKDVFAVPPDSTSWSKIDKVGDPGGCGNYWLEKSGALFLSDDQLCTVGGACTKLAGTPLGWLDAGATFLLPDIRGPQ